MRDEVDDHLINSMAVVLDVVIPEDRWRTAMSS